MRRTGSSVRGRNSRSARHHSRKARNEPLGVPPSPSRLSALMPLRPNATGNASGPAKSQPWERRPGRRQTRRAPREVPRLPSLARRLNLRPKFGFPSAACSFARECSTSRQAARQNRGLLELGGGLVTQSSPRGGCGADGCRTRVRFSSSRTIPSCATR
jgi:hypothetical protein